MINSKSIMQIKQKFRKNEEEKEKEKVYNVLVSI